MNAAIGRHFSGVQLSYEGNDMNNNRSNKSRMISSSSVFNRTSYAAKQKSKDATKKRLMSAYQIKSKLKENPTLRYNLDLADYSDRKTVNQKSKLEKAEVRRSIVIAPQ